MRGAAVLFLMSMMGATPSLAVSVDVTAPAPSAADATLAAIEEAAASSEGQPRPAPSEIAANPQAPALGGVVPAAGLSFPVPPSLLLFLAGLAGVVVIHRRPIR